MKNKTKNKSFLSEKKEWIQLNLRLVGLLSLNSMHTLNQVFEGDMDKRNLIFKLISLKEEEESNKRIILPFLSW